jgi:hypothetical protein
MADRSVKVQLDLDVRPFITALSKAEAAAKAFRDGLGKPLPPMPDPFEPYDEEQKKRRREAPKEGDQIAGAFARAFSRRIETAFKSLPKAELDADASEAQKKLQEVRSSLQTLAGKQIGVDIDVSSALTDVATLRLELDRLSDTADIDVRADTMAALAQLQALQQEVDKLNEPIEPHVNVDPAKQALADLRDRMAELSGRTIGIDLDAGAAKAEIAAIERELQRLNTTSTDIDVRVDTTKALADVRALESSLTSVSNRSARIKVDADVGGALASIALVGAALASLPAVTTIAVGVGALGGAFAAAGAGAAGFAAVAVPSLGRINEALQQQATAAGGAGGATKSAGQSAAEAASQSLQLEQAERRVADSQKTVKQAQEDLTRARRDAKRALEDYSLSVKDAALAEEDAALSVEEAARRLAEVQADPEATDLEVRRAELNHRQAMQRLDEQQVRTKRLKEDKAEADKKGVEGSDQVRGAQDKLLKSQADLTEAQKQLTVLQLQQKAATESAGGAAGGAASKFAELSKAEQALAKDIKAFQDGYVEWQRSLQPDVFPVIRSGMDLLNTGMKLSTPLVKASAGAFKTLVDEMNEGLKSEQWTGFFDDLTEQAPRAIDGLGTSAVNVAGGLAGVIQAFLPYTDDLMTFLENATQGFEDWGQNLKGSPEFEQFIDYVKTNGPKVGELLGNVATFAGKILEVGGDLGPGVLDFLVTLSDELASMSPEQVEAIAKGVGLIVAAVKLGATLKIGALVLLADVLADMSPGQIEALALAIGGVIVAVKGYQAVSGAVGFFQGLSGSIDKAGKSADGAGGKLGGLTGLFKGGAIVGSVAGLALAFDKIGDSLDGLNPDIAELSKNLSAFGKGGEPANALLDQLDPKLQSVVGRFEDFGESASRLASDNPLAKISDSVTGFLDDSFGLQLDGGRQAIDNLDKSLATMVGNGNGAAAAEAFNRLADRAVAAGTPVDRLKELFPEYASSLDGAIPQTGAMTDAMSKLKIEVDPTAVAMDKFNSGLDTFNAKTDVAARTLELKDAFNQAKDAIAEAGGKLDFSSQMTDKQKEAVIKARDEFGGYIEKVLAAAKAAGELAGKNGEAALKSDEARDAFIRQLPHLFDLAGKSKEARDRIYDMAAGFGVNRDQADKASTGVKGVKDVIAGLKGKKVDVGVDTKQGHEALQALQKAIFEMASANIKLTLDAIIKKETGGIVAYEAGGIERYASGTIRSTAPAVASGPTILYGEGKADEAFIPYDPAYRERATALLAQVANDFGLSLNNQQAAQGLSDLSVTIDSSGMVIANGLTSVMGSLQATMGQAGTLTSSISKVGSSADQLNAGWLAGSAVIGDAVGLVSSTTASSTTQMSGSIDGLTSSVTSLGEAISTAAVVSASISKQTASKSSSGSGGFVSADLKKTMGDSSKSKSAGGLIAGDTGNGGFVATGDMVSVGMASAPNTSRVSAPQQASQPSYSPPASTTPVEGTSGAWGREGMANSGPAVVIQNQTVYHDADADRFAAQAAMRVRGRGR